MPRYKLTIEYAGTGLHGWQRQPGGATVQSHLEDAFSRLTGRFHLVQGAGRTDAGVHATGQVAHIDLPDGYRPEEIRGAVNFHLRPALIAVLDVALAPEPFHARLSATRRSYLYRIINRRAPSVLEMDRVWHLGVSLDSDAMAEGARHLVGHHDFTSFRASQCQAKSPEKTLERLDVTRVGDEIQIIAEARSFLHHQVRNMVGTLKMVGTGQWTPDQVASALAARKRSAAGPTAPPEGLYLTAVGYDATNPDDDDPGEE